MTIVAVASVADAPGASTLAVGLATTWPVTDPLPFLLEADPDGGRLGTRLGVGVEPGLMSVALSSRSGRLDVIDLVTASAEVGAWRLLPSPASAEQTHSALLYSASTLAATMAADPGRGWIVDAGRVSPRSPAFPLVAKADHLLLATRGDLAALQLLPTRVDALRSGGVQRVSIVVVGFTPWRLDEVVEFSGCDVAGSLPLVAGGGLASMAGRRWREWWAAAADLATMLCDEAVEVAG